MSIANLFDHRAVLYRPPAGGMDASGFPTEGAWATPTTPSGLNARPDQSWTGGLGVSPIGETQTATRVWYLSKGFTDIEERDILDIVSGPEATNRYRVESVTRPTAPSAIHHVEVATSIHEGALG